jgi:hypothetical protein
VVVGRCVEIAMHFRVLDADLVDAPPVPVDDLASRGVGRERQELLRDRAIAEDRMPPVTTARRDDDHTAGFLTRREQRRDRGALDEGIVDGVQEERLGFLGKHAQTCLQRGRPPLRETGMADDLCAGERSVGADPLFLASQDDDDRVAPAFGADADDAVDDGLLPEDQQRLRIPHPLGRARRQHDGGDLSGLTHALPEYTPRLWEGEAPAGLGASWGKRGRIGAGNGIRTRDFNLGKVALYH